jgi:LCP family protein required for cell wall assembly
MNHARPRKPPPSAGAALFLTLLWPGAGHAYFGRPQTGAKFAIPFAVVVAPVLLIALGGIRGLAAAFLVPGNALLLTIAIVVATGIWIAALTDIYRTTRRTRRVAPGRATAVLIAIVGLVGSYAAFSAWSLYDATNRVFQPGLGTVSSPGPDRPRPSADVGGIPTPAPSVPSADERMNVLLIGADSGLGYEHALTDTIMVVSVDPTTKSVAMISVPRDTARFPLYSGGTYDAKINSLVTVADADPERFPDGGLGTLSRAVGHLIGAPIHYVAYINLSGFRDLVDAVGGVDVNVDRALNDRGYQFPDGKIGFRMAAGPQHLDGRLALAFVRSRNSPGENDFTRSRRQQQFLVALRDKLTSPAMLPRLPAILDAGAGLVTTNFPPERIGELIDLAGEIPAENITGVVLGPPYAKRPTTAGEYILVPDLNKMAEWSVELFGPSSRYAGG